MDLILETFEPAFMQRALIGSLIAVVATSLVGTWVVLRGLSFLGDALAHGVVPGVAVAVLVGFNPILGAFVAAIVMSGLITFVSSRTTVRDDTAIGLLFVGMLSLGVVLVSRSQSFTTDLTSLLFGDVLGASFQAVGTLLVFAFLVGPPATAALMVRRVRMIMVTSIALGSVAVVAGLMISFHYATAGGATIAGVSIAQFFVVYEYGDS